MGRIGRSTTCAEGLALDLGIKQTAASNRLEKLRSLGLLTRKKNGRAWDYRAVKSPARIPTVDAEEPVEAWRTDGHGNWYGVARLKTSKGIGVPVTEIVYSPHGKPIARVMKPAPEVTK